ncbi:DNA-directed RNA polymerase subunit beta', partial [Candidatus Daviesbacteria bacterium RIFCSPHIGHO2_01_FULL_38_8]
VDSLIDTTARTSRRVAAGTHQLRSLSDMLRGKQGRFRQNLLGKRVDYSGRSVIIVGPKLKLNQVGVPKEMALEMFKPFVLREMMARGLASNVKGAKNLLELKPSEVWDILEQVIENHPVLINRAPTLHRLGIQSFFPVLVDGNSIQIHPCICAGFNADFDGDQMAIHVPLSEKAREEAIELMMAKENILKGSDGSPINVPNREMALGSFYITSIDQSKEFDEKQIYTKDEAILAYQTSKLPLRKLIKCEVNGEIYETTVGRIIFNNVIPEKLRFINEAVNGVAIRKIVMGAFRILNREELAVLVDDIKALGFWGSTISGLSLAISDNKILPNKKDMIAAGDKEIEEIEENYKKGLITTEERRELSQEVWTRIGEDIARKTIAEIEPDNPIKVIMQSGGARATVEQIKQVSGMRGFSVDATGKIVELPTKSNYREGLGVFEYFNSCRGARKGLVDKGLRTADAGYLTRRLVDVSHDTIIRSEECETEEGLTLTVDINNPGSNTPSLLGRRLLKKAVGKDKKTVLEAGAYLEEDQISQLVEAQVEEVTVRSPLTCQARYGICSNCYGLDLSTRKPVKMGVPVGVIAAQSIGEPGTQLTMRTFHTGGILGADITAGLPRVEELFEARTPKIISPVSEIAGKVSIIENEEGRVVRVRTTTKPHEEREYTIALSANILVEDGDLISAGTQLTAGPLDVKEVLRVKGLREAQRYIVSEVKKVYESQGVSINEKHFEVIVRKMSDKVRVETQGDTNLLPGEVVDRIRFEEENKRVLSEGGEPATAGVVILGITRASLLTESFLSAASFQETTTVLADAAAQGKVDKLLGMKENVIIGRLIPTSADRAALE